MLSDQVGVLLVTYVTDWGRGQEKVLSHYAGLAYKQRAHKVEVELDGSREQEKMLSDQVRGLLVTLC